LQVWHYSDVEPVAYVAQLTTPVTHLVAEVGAPVAIEPSEVYTNVFDVQTEQNLLVVLKTWQLVTGFTHSVVVAGAPVTIEPSEV
jgi:hypothetical protein